MMPTSVPKRERLGELVFYFLRLGCLGFGGPVALVGQMERDLVADRGWLTKEQMREAIAICQSLPGPLAIQVGIYISYLRCGFWGAWAGGWAFILPNFAIVAALGALYVYLGDLQPVTAIFYGVSPAVIALILHSCYRLAKLGMEDWVQWGIAGVCLIVTVILQAEVALLFIGAGIIGILYYGRFGRPPPVMLGIAAAPVAAQLAPVASGSTLGKLLFFFLKAGSLTFGSGLVIVPFLEQGLVQQYGWLDQRQFLIAVAVGMISPGPAVITATLCEIIDPRHRRGQARGGADAERPTRAEPISDPTDDRRPDGGTAQRCGEQDRHHTAAHDRLGRQLHQAIRRDSEGLGGHADNEQSEPEEPAVGHDRGQRAAEPEDCCGTDQKRDAGFCPPGSDERTDNRSDRHNRSQKSVLARSGVKD
jgi:putative chromate ion transporter